LATISPDTAASEAETFREDKHSDETDFITFAPPSSTTSLHALPRGSGPGVLIHDLLEQCAQIGFAAVLEHTELAREIIARVFVSTLWDGKRECLLLGLQNWLTLPLIANKALNLSQLPSHHYQAEMEFLLGAEATDTVMIDRLVCQHMFPGQARPQLQAKQINGFLKGFIDLIFEYEGRYYVLDYKFNALGDKDQDYSQNNLVQAMLGKRYDLQAVLYLLALHRLLKCRLGTDYDYDQHMGGYVYLFLRGNGRIEHKPPKILITSLDALFANAVTLGAE